MKTMEWRFEDNRKHWLPEARTRTGPWDGEPDKRQWTDATTGLPCLILRNHYGVLCGYVGVPNGHPWYGQNYDDVDALVDPHGGLTFANSCSKTEPERGICHVVEPGESDDVWWLGFDCAHAWDLVPGFDWTDGEYRDVAYVTAECEKLAAVCVSVTMESNK